MKIVFRTDASIWIGSGHVMRCLVLAEALRSVGCEIYFACLPQSGNLIEYIEKNSFSVIKLGPVTQIKSPRFDGDYESWLQRSEHDDACDFIQKILTADWVVTDHYGIGLEWEMLIKKALSCKILSIDDLDRAHCCDVILDQNLWPNMNLRYVKTSARALLGPCYALLRAPFRALKSSPPSKINQLLAFFGGSDPTKECQKLLEAASCFSGMPFKLKVVTGWLNLDFESLVKYERSGYIEVVRFIDDFELELAMSKYVIGASGVSNWERFCLNIPATIVSVADNQRELSQYLVARDYVTFLGSGTETTSVSYRDELCRLKKIWNSIKPFTSLDVDGNGVHRVLKVMESFSK
ncbi:UDP-2,4-diacetamido-2,4,6-trideoxy-beta-L-altropyranose hydrolase [Shewanella sp. 125m-7]